MLGIAIAVALLLEIIWIARQVLTWILIAIFLALALNPAVDWFQRHGHQAARRRDRASRCCSRSPRSRRSAPLFVPTLVDEVNGFADALPGYVDDITQGRGRARLPRAEVPHRRAGPGRGRERAARRSVLGLSGTAVAVTKGIVTAIVAIVTIAFMTFFMLLEGPRWVERFFALLPERSQERWRASAARSTGRSAAT